MVGAGSDTTFLVGIGTEHGLVFSQGGTAEGLSLSGFARGIVAIEDVAGARRSITLDDVIVDGCADACVVFDGDYDITANDVQVLNAGTSGIELLGTAQLNATDLETSESGANGLYVQESAVIDIDGYVSDDNGEAGLLMVSDSTTTSARVIAFSVDGNNVANQDASGMAFVDVNTVELENGTVSGTLNEIVSGLDQFRGMGLAFKVDLDGINSKDILATAIDVTITGNPSYGIAFVDVSDSGTIDFVGRQLNVSNNGDERSGTESGGGMLNDSDGDTTLNIDLDATDPNVPGVLAPAYASTFNRNGTYTFFLEFGNGGTTIHAAGITISRDTAVPAVPLTGTINGENREPNTGAVYKYWRIDAGSSIDFAL